ncbi:MAG: hypothetical protein R6U19_07775 [Bacteroidales bacterium]
MEKALEPYSDVIQYLKLNYINLVFILLFVVAGFLRYESVVGIAYENNSTEAIKLILETVNNVEGVLKGDKKPAIMINELGKNTINIKVMFWVDTFYTTKQSVHNSIRSKLMNDDVVALIDNGFTLPASVIELKNFEP